MNFDYKIELVHYLFFGLCFGFFQVPIHVLLASLKCKLTEAKIHLRQNCLSYLTDCCMSQQQQNLQDSHSCRSLEPHLVVKQSFLGAAASNNNNKKSKLVPLFQTIFVLTLY